MQFSFDLNGFDDWSGLHKLLVNAFSYMDGVVDPPSSLHRLTSDGLREKAQEEALLLVFDHHLLIACAFFKLQSESVYMGKLAIVDAYRGRGIARKIVEYANDFACDNGKAFLELETRIELHANHKVFTKLGFVKSGENRHQGFDRSTSITMRREVLLG